MNAAEITSLLRSHRYPLGTEAALQAEIEKLFNVAGVAFERERRLGPADRIDFLCAGGIGIEAKVRSGKRIIYRQLARYSCHEAITALILVTNTAMGLPPNLNGRPLYYVSLGRAAL